MLTKVVPGRYDSTWKVGRSLWRAYCPVCRKMNLMDPERSFKPLEKCNHFQQLKDPGQMSDFVFKITGNPDADICQDCGYKSNDPKTMLSHKANYCPELKKKTKKGRNLGIREESPEDEEIDQGVVENIVSAFESLDPSNSENVRKFAEQVKANGVQYEDAMGAFRKLWASKRKGAVDPILLKIIAIVYGVKGSAETISKGERIESGELVYFDDYRDFNPALDFVDEIMYLGVRLPYEKKIINSKGKELGTRKELENFVVLDNGEIFRLEATDLFQDKKLRVHVPEGLFDQRWSTKSLKAFREEHTDYNPFAVFSELRDTWNYYMDFGEVTGADTVNALYDILSYCFPLFTSIPYLRYIGDKGSAKSKGGRIHEQVAFNALNAVAFSAASMFRTVQDERAALIIDEAEDYGHRTNKTDQQEAIGQIINSGWQVQGKVPRIETIGTKRVKVNYSTYGPKVICGISEVSDTLRDRSYEIMLHKTLDKTKAERSVKANDPKWQNLRDSLYCMVMNHWKEIRSIADEEKLQNKLELIGRDWDKALPLLVLAEFISRHAKGKDEQLVDDVWSFLKEQKEKETEIQLESLDQVIIQELEEKIKEVQLEEGLVVGNTDVVRVPLGKFSQRVADVEGKSTQRNFHLRRYSRFIKQRIERLDLGVDFRPGTDHLTFFETGLKRVQEARVRYKLPGEEGECNNVIPSITLTTLNHLITLITSLGKLAESRSLKIDDEVRNQMNHVKELITSYGDSVAAGLLESVIKVIKIHGIDTNKEGAISPESEKLPRDSGTMFDFTTEKTNMLNTSSAENEKKPRGNGPGGNDGNNGKNTISELKSEIRNIILGIVKGNSGPSKQLTPKSIQSLWPPDTSFSSVPSLQTILETGYNITMEIPHFKKGNAGFYWDGAAS